MHTSTYPALTDARATVLDPTAPRGRHLMSWLLLKGERGQTCHQAQLLQMRRDMDPARRAIAPS